MPEGMSQVEFGEFIGRTKSDLEALDRRVSEQGKSFRSDLQVLRDEFKSGISSLEADIKALRNRRYNGKDRAFVAGTLGFLVALAESLRYFLG